jgi:hypothetical protein
VPKEEMQFFGQHKTISIGKVKSYGSNTCVQSSVGLGAQGSPVFNELGRCWGILTGSLNDLPQKVTPLPDTLSASIVEEAKEEKETKKNKKTKKEKKKDSKKKKKKTKKVEPRPSVESMEVPDSGPSQDETFDMGMEVSVDDSESYEVSVAPAQNNGLTEENFDVVSEHCLMPLIPAANSFNRNMVLSIGHSGVKFVLDRVAKLH